ncbi:hypothetical protein [Candidatus Karelsulcia muelleri]|uniref:hypothetical protein n=1 Tax=Candidatus Karelsulcia muelleri TaxID=336810 RepID=UPI000B92E567|nr:hypothetical protein [Candidatus Karelsulcia muelleri]ASS46827.1 hypothetical protein CA211_022 [Candidatus Karelsulcia muelleri]
MISTGRQVILFFMQCLTNKKPGSDIIGVPASAIKAILLYVMFSYVHYIYDNILFFILKKFNKFL